VLAQPKIEFIQKILAIKIREFTKMVGVTNRER